MSLDIAENRARVGCYHVRATRPPKAHRLNLRDVLLAIFLYIYGIFGLQLMLFLLMCKENILSSYFERQFNFYSQTWNNINPRCNQGVVTFLTNNHLHFRYIEFISLLLKLAGDVESNPGPSTVSHKDLTICHLNCQSMFHKLDLIALELSMYDIITLSETWLDQSIDTMDILIPNYQEPIRLDRNRHGGGVAVYFSKSVPFVERKELQVPNLEAI